MTIINEQRHRREDLHPLAADLLEFLQDRPGVDIPVPEMARCFRVAEWEVLLACRELYAARDAVTVTVTRGPDAFEGVLVIDNEDAERIACHWREERGPVTTRDVALERIASEDDVLSMLLAYVDHDVFDVTVRA